MSENKKADPKVFPALKDVYDFLTEEQKEKAKKCKTMDELIKLAGEEGIELPDEMLDAAGGVQAGLITEGGAGEFSGYDDWRKKRRKPPAAADSALSINRLKGYDNERKQKHRF